MSLLIRKVDIMLYLISDIHGELHDFKKLLKKIKFDKEKDNMIIMGDILDRGPDGVALLEYIKPYILDNSMKLLLGNHELFAIMYLNVCLAKSIRIRYLMREHGQFLEVETR